MRKSRRWSFAALLSAGLITSLGNFGCSSGGYKDPNADEPGGEDGRRDAAMSDDRNRDGGSADSGSGQDLAPDLTPASSDPFDPASCAGPAWSSSAALAVLGMAPRVKLADATLYRRTRSCTGMTPATCGAWSAPVAHTQALLTYSGGVVTDYKTFSFPTHLLLFAQAGQPKLVVRHETDYRHDATANNRGVVFPFGADPMVNTYPVINVWDFAPAPNRYDDLAGLLGGKAQLHASANCARAVFTDGLTLEIVGLYRY